MCEVLDTLRVKYRKEGREEGREEGRKEGKKRGEMEMGLKMIQKNFLTVEKIAAELNMTPSQFWEEAKSLGLLDDVG